MNFGFIGYSAPEAPSPQLIRRVVIGQDIAAPAASFGSIDVPARFSHLWLALLVRSDQATTAQNVYLQFNGDATNANYASEFTGSGGTGSGANPQIAWVAGATSTANRASVVNIYVMGYASDTFYKTATSVYGQGSDIASYSMVWANKAPVTSLKVVPSAGNFVAGSMLTLYGLP